MVSIGARKDGFDIDEFFTYGLANSYHQPFLNTETGRWISGKAFSITSPRAAMRTNI
ncbi:MAG: hypothetical protein ACLUI3_08415 [Christensenellales bacterium]